MSSPENPTNYWFSRHSKFIIFSILILTVVGIYQALTLPVAVFPETSFPRIKIGVENGVMPIEQMEVSVTRPIEQAVNGVPGLEIVRSTTSRGAAEVDLLFDWSVNIIDTLQFVNAAVSRVQSSLPPTARVETHRMDFSIFPIVGYSLTSNTVSQADLWELATYEIKPRLNRLKGVASVVIQGGREPEFHVIVDPARLLRSKVSVADILTAVNQTNIIESPGLLDRNHELFLGLINTQVHDEEEIGKIAIKTVGNVPVQIRDVADVSKAVAPVYTSVSANGKPAVLVSVNRQPDSNTVQVADEVHEEMKAIRPTLPAGIDVRPFYDQSNIVNASVASVRDATVIGLFLAAFVIWLFLRDWGTALMTGLVVPATIVVTFIAMKALGQSFNLMTLGGLAAAVGLAIDDKIVVVENIVLHRDAGQGPLEATSSALKELTVPLIGSTLTPIVVFLPLITITGVTGKFFGALAIAMSVSLLASLVLALVWTSNLSTRLIRRRQTTESDASHAERGLFRYVVRAYERIMRRGLKSPLLLGLFCAALIAISYACFIGLGSDLLPPFDEGGFILDYVMPPGTSLAETDRVMKHVEAILESTPEVESTSRRTGLELGMVIVTEPNTGDIAVKLKDDRTRSLEDVISDVRARIRREEPVLDIEFVQVLQDMIGDLTGFPQPVVVKLFSNDSDLLHTWAPRVADALAETTIEGKNAIVDIEDGIENTTSGPALMFTVDPQRAARAGFTSEELRLVTAAVMDGAVAEQPIIANGRPYPLRVRFPAEDRASLDAIRNTILVNSSGGTATLGSVSDVVEFPGQTEIRRESLQSVVQVTARLEDVDLGTGIAAVKKTIGGLNLPHAIRVEYGGTYEEQQKSFRDLSVVLLLAVVLIFLVLLFEFRTFIAPVAILSSAVLSTSGVFVALLVTNTTFNVSSFMGLIMVIGIVAKNGILLLDANEKFLAAGMSREEAIIHAGRRRLRPIVMTALAAVAGMLPLALSLGSGSQMLQPLAIAVIGGISVSMVLSLVITPAIQYFLERSPRPGRVV